MSSALRLLPVLAGLVILSGSARAGDPRGFAMGGTDAALARGADAVLWNPASLGLPDAPAFSMRLFSAGARADNNSFSLDQYRRLNGADWGDAQKSEILSSVGSNGFVADVAGGAGSGISLGKFGAYLDGAAIGRSSVARDAFDIGLYGDELGRSYDLGGSGGIASATGRLLLGFAIPMRADRNSASAFGIQLGIERGVRWEDASTLNGQFLATQDSADVRGDFLLREGTRASGMSLGAGWAFSNSAGNRFSFNIRDLYNRLSWTGTDRRYHMQGDHGVDGTDNLDSLFSSSSDPAVPVTFTTHRSAVVSMAGSHNTARTTNSFLMEKGLGTDGGVSSQVRAAYGLEVRGLGPVALRGGLSLGGGWGTWLSGGAGLAFGPLHIDAAVGSRGLSPSNSQGVGVSVGGSIGI